MITFNNAIIGQMGGKKLGFVSQLMKKDVHDMKTSRWMDILKEFRSLFPDLFAIIMCILLDKDKISLYTQLQVVIPRISLIYGILMQTRNQSLSRIQRITSLLLLDNICDQKVRIRQYCNLQF